MFKIVVPCRNVENYIDRCINSLLIQEEKDWIACVMVDPPTDNTIERVLKWKSEKIIVNINSTIKYALENTINAIRILNPNNDDIICVIDGDDWLYGKYSLTIVKEYYEKYPNLLLTHGSYIPYPYADEINCNYPYTKDDFLEIRKKLWRSSHLRTFKYKLYKNVKDSDLRDRDGKYFTSACDVALMIPMLEMAGYDRIKFIHQLVYIYNMENNYNNFKINSAKQTENALYIYSLNPYKRIEDV